MPSQSRTIKSTIIFAVAICIAVCKNAVHFLNGDEAFLTGLNKILDATVDIPVTVAASSDKCTLECTLVPPERRFVYLFETYKDISPVTSKDSERRLLTFSTTVVNIIVDMVNTGESVDPAQLLEKFEINKNTLN